MITSTCMHCYITQLYSTHTDTDTCAVQSTRTIGGSGGGQSLSMFQIFERSSLLFNTCWSSDMSTMNHSTKDS